MQILMLAVVLALFVADVWLFSRLFVALSRPKMRARPAWVRFAVGVTGAFLIVALTLLVRCDAWALFAAALGAAVGARRYEGEGFGRIGSALGRWRLAILLLSVAGAAGLGYLYIPLTTFMTSPGEIGLHLDYLLSVNTRDAMMLVYAALAAYLLAISDRMRTVMTLAALAALTLGIVYAYVLPFGYPRMTGLTFERIAVPVGQHVLRWVLDVVLVVAVAVALRHAILRWGGRVITAALVLANLSLVTAAAFEVSRDQVGLAGGSTGPQEASSQLLRFSREHPNVLILYLDRFMGSYVESITAAHPELTQRLDGFTWYPRTLAAGENSIAGLHPMLGGYDYTPVEMNARGERLVDLSIEAFRILPLNFARAGYTVNVVNPGGLGFTMAGDCRHLAFERVRCGHIPPSIVKARAEQFGFPLAALSRADYADLLSLIGSMRGAPYAYKDILYARGPWRRYMDHTAGTTFRVWAELDAFDELTDTGADEPNLNIIGNLLPHEPYYMGEDCRPRTEDPPFTEAQARARGHLGVFSLQHAIAARCALLMVADYLDFLKVQGVYDRSRIVIVSDHGISGEVRDDSTRAIAGGTQDAAFVRSRSVLLVKDPDERGPLRVSETFMPNAEVPRLVCEAIGGCVNPFLGDRPIAAHGRDDPFHVSIVPWRFSRQKDRAFVVDESWILTGRDPFDARGWRRE